jgi:predicted alpha/beta-hydrolase family hydrolase
MARRGYLSVKFNFPFMEPMWSLTRRPDPKDVLVGCYRKVLDEVRTQHLEKLVIGGMGLGAAVASHTVSDAPGRSDVDGLFFLGYPIHRPDDPEELGVKHLFEILKPMLFISGSRDSSAQPERLKNLVSELEPRASLHLVEGRNQSLNVRLGRRVYFKMLDRTATILEEWLKTRISQRR